MSTVSERCDRIEPPRGAAHTALIAADVPNANRLETSLRCTAAYRRRLSNEAGPTPSSPLLDLLTSREPRPVADVRCDRVTGWPAGATPMDRAMFAEDRRSRCSPSKVGSSAVWERFTASPGNGSGTMQCRSRSALGLPALDRSSSCPATLARATARSTRPQQVRPFGHRKIDMRIPRYDDGKESDIHIPLTRPRTPWCWATTAYDAGSRPPAAAPVELAGNGCSTSSTRPVHAGHARAHNRRELGSVPADPVATKPRPGRSRGSIRRHQRRRVRPGFGCVSRRSFLLDTRPESAGRRKQGGPPFVPWHRELGSSRNERVLEGGGSEHRVELRGLVNDRKHRQT
jgi:hypothetical protein